MSGPYPPAAHGALAVCAAPWGRLAAVVCSCYPPHRCASDRSVAEAVASGTNVASFGIDGSVKAVVIPHGAHHLDLMFSTPDDPPDVTAARTVELAAVAEWVKAWTAR